MKNVTRIGWRVLIDGKEYGDDIPILGEMKNNKDIKMTVGILAEQMIASLQKIVTGKNDYDVMQEEAEKKFEEMGK